MVESQSDVSALKRFMDRILSETVDDGEETAMDVTQPQPIVVIGNSQSGLSSLVRALQILAKERRTTSASAYTTTKTTDCIDLQGSRWADYQVAHLNLGEDCLVLHMIHPDGSSKLRSLIQNGKMADATSTIEGEDVDEGDASAGTKALKLKLNGWLNAGDEDREADDVDPLARVRPPRCIEQWKRTSAVVVLTLSEASQLLMTASSHLDLLKAMFTPLLRTTTTKEDRDALKTSALSYFPPELLKQWRLEAGLPEIDGEGNDPITPLIPVPVTVVVTRGDLTDSLRERAYQGERDIIEASLLRFCASIGASLVMCDVGKTDARGNEIFGDIQNLPILLEIISAMTHRESLASLPPPQLPQCLGLPSASKEEDLIWIPAGLIRVSEAAQTDALQTLGDRPFDIAVTFSDSVFHTSGTQDLPPEISVDPLSKFIQSMSDVVAEAGSDHDEHFMPLGSLRGVEEEKKKDKSQPQELKTFFGDLIRQKKQGEGKPAKKEKVDKGDEARD